MIFRNIKFAWDSLMEAKFKSLLSIIGIAISVITLISILSISQSFSKYIEDQFSIVGTNLMWVEAENNTDMGIQTAKNIGNLSFVDKASAAYTTGDKIYEGNNTGAVTVCGVNNEYASIVNMETAGQFISEDDCSNQKAVCVISDDVRKKYVYKELNPIGKQINISGINYTIIGYINKSELDSTGFVSGVEPENAIYIPYTTFQNNYRSQSLSRIVFQTNNSGDIKQYENQIDGIMKNGITKGISYKINSIAGSMNNVLSMIDKVNIFFIIFIAITLLISGIGIMNVMLMTTMEKKWEIGLRQSIGAGGTDILLQFVIEILILSIIGAVIGVFFGVLIILSIAAYESTIFVSMQAVMLSVLFCFIISFIFGLIPSVKASKLLPLECLEKD